MAHTQVVTTQRGGSFFAQRVPGALQKAWGRYWALRAERATIMVLHSLDDRTLKDIGMDRSEIESVVSGSDCVPAEFGGRRIKMSLRS